MRRRMWGRNPKTVSTDATVGTVRIDRKVWDVLRELHQRLPHVEFLVVLYGRRLGSAEFTVEEFYVPPQTVTAASVEPDMRDVPECMAGFEQVGTYHSHVNMSVFASGTDLRYLTSSFPITLVGNNDGEVAGFVAEDANVFGDNYRLVARLEVHVERPKELLEAAMTAATRIKVKKGGFK